jgi:anti-sigma factor ChrR (cupin superfamily)
VSVTPSDLHAYGPAAAALGALERQDERAFEAHAAVCDECRRAVADLRDLAAAALAGASPVAPPMAVRDQVLAFADAPRGEVDTSQYTWREIAPGFRVHDLRDDPERGIRTLLIWADAGATNVRHRHLGEEHILVLKGTLKDDRGIYRAGEMCHSRPGEVHAEATTAEEECVCFAIYQDGGIEPV